MAFITWATNVNKIIEDSTNVIVGEGGAQHDTLEAPGIKKSRTTCSNPPDKFAVTMNFNFVERGADGLTEIERFYSWYKWKHCYGTNPFKFPAILINSNRQIGSSVEERTYQANAINNQQHPEVPVTPDDIPQYEYYKITSAVDSSKSGNDQQVKMTWETYATGIISIPDDTVEVDKITPANGEVSILLTDTPQLEPDINTYSLAINGEPEPVTGFMYDGAVNVTLFFDKKSAPGVYEVEVDGKTGSFEVR